MATDSHRRKHIGRLPLTALAVGLLVVLGVLALPAFAADDTTPSPGDAVREAAAAKADKSDESAAEEQAEAPDPIEATFASLSEDEAVAFNLYFMSAEEKARFKIFLMSPEEREQFFDYITPPPPPPPAPTRSATTSAPAVSSGSVWDSLAQCESGGVWSINTGNGFHGGLQFHPSTWTGYGGGAYAPYAYQASRSAQIAVAERVLASQGWGAWPACSARLGLR